MTAIPTSITPTRAQTSMPRFGFGQTTAASVVANWVSTSEPTSTQSGTCAIQPWLRPIRKSGATTSGASSQGFHSGARLDGFTVTHRPGRPPS